MLLRGGIDRSGTPLDVRIEGSRIAALGRLEPRPGEAVEELAGMLLLPSLVEPHAHLDKALSAEAAPNDRGDLMGAIEAWRAHSEHLSVHEMAERAERAARMMIGFGVTTISTHVDLHEGVGLRAVEALVAVRERLSGLVELRITALTGWPTTGVAGEPLRALRREALALGVDALGGCPHLEDDGPGSIDVVLAMAAEAGVALDLHVDETLNPECLTLEVLAERVLATGFAHPVAASHCVSLGMQTAAVQQRVADKVAAAGISVIALPQTNLYLQARGMATAPPRGLTAVAALRAAGATVAAGADNVQDPFNLVGRADPLETAALMVMAGHLSPTAAFDTVTAAARRALGLEPVELAVGSTADLLAIGAASVREAVAAAPLDRVVVHRGRVVSRTRVVRDAIDPNR
jgi:cytosine deaminase